MEYGIIAIVCLLPTMLVLLFIVLDKNFCSYTRTIPMPPKHLKPKQCNHKWQSRGQNGYGITTYKVCLKCREPQQRINNLGESDKFVKCNPIPFLDSQFDKNDKYIF